MTTVQIILIVVGSIIGVALLGFLVAYIDWSSVCRAIKNVGACFVIGVICILYPIYWIGCELVYLVMLLARAIKRKRNINVELKTDRSE